MKLYRKNKKKIESGQDSLFDEPEDCDISSAEFPLYDLLAHEYETLGLYISGHPLDDFVADKTSHDAYYLQYMQENSDTSFL